MNQIIKSPISSLGYDFIPKEFIPRGKNEYHLRYKQNRNGTKYRKLTTSEIKALEKNGNSSDDWNKMQVADGFDPKLVINCAFYGLVRIGKMEPCFVEFNNLRLPVGLYYSTIISCDIGDNTAINNVNFMSHYIIGNEVILVNINELATTNHSKFGNGVLKEGENESVRIWMEICNENAGRSVLPYNGMLAADAWLWSKNRDDEKLMQKLKEFTDNKFDTQRGYYGKIGDRTVIKNCKIIKDVWIGSDAYLKGANKIKNVTINSSPESQSQIGEGCELVNGIIGFGCRIFYGVKAVRFMMGTNSQLKYGARLINSYLGDNSTISCCEVLNSLIYSAHEQHHNNSFLCAATVMGQSNMAAGATIGSNHNSRSADGELQAGRGFWPGLCVSLKHNSKFASFTIIAKGDFPAELNIPIPFSLVSNDVSRDKIVVLPGYWFMYNMYALARNEDKYKARDKRTDKSLIVEYDFLAPDSVNEMFDGIELMKKFTAAAYETKNKKIVPSKIFLKTGERLLENNETANLEILAYGFENSKRKTELIKVPEAYHLFKKLIAYYGISELIRFIELRKITSWQNLLKVLPSKPLRTAWINNGGQLMTEDAVKALVKNIRSGKISNWDDVHDHYLDKSSMYHTEKFRHAFASLLEVLQIPRSGFTKKLFISLLQQALQTREWITKGIFDSRAKDYSNPFRKMVYETEKEMEKVIGKLGENSFIKEQEAAAKIFSDKINNLLKQFS